MRYHQPHIAGRLMELGQRLSLVDPRCHADRFLDAIAALVEAVGIPGFDSFGIPEVDYDRIAAGAVANGSNDSNPQPMESADYLSILASLGP